MADSRDLLVRILGDDRSLQQAFTRTERRTKQFETRTARLGGGLTKAFAAAGISLGAGLAISQANELVNTASDLNEQIDRTKVIFGESADSIIEWSKTTADAAGISQRAALAAASNFGGLFQTVGVSVEKAEELSRVLVQLAADFASLQNTSPEEALQALRSGLAGEAEPLRRYNVFLTEASVQQRAMEESGKKNAKSLTQQEKALARFNIILEQGAPAMGNFADTSDGLANKTRQLRANFDDLKAQIGQALIPIFSDAVEAADDLLFVIGKLSEAEHHVKVVVDFVGGATPNIPGTGLGVEDWFKVLLTPGAPITVPLKIITEIGDVLRPEPESLPPGAKGPGQGIGEDIARRQKEQAEKDARAAKSASRALKRRREAFDEFLKGMGLKLDRAELTPRLSDDIAVLDEIEAAIQRQIRREGRTFKLVEALTDVRRQRAALVEQRAQDAADRAREAFQNIIDGLDLKLRQAMATPGLKDDLRALRDLENAIRERIKEEGRTIELLNELQDIRERRREIQEQQRQQQRERRQARQFEALGLTAEGDPRTPSTGALKRRLGSLREQIKGTALDTEQTRTQLQRIAKVLSGQFGKVGEDVRKAILEMFRNISDALKSGDRSAAAGGEITPGGIKQIDNLVKGLGLTDEQIAAIHERNQQIRRRPRSSAFGFGLEPSGGGRTSTTNVPHGAAREDVNIFVTLELDGKEIANSTIRHAQKQGNRRAPARRGRHGGRNLGLG